MFPTAHSTVTRNEAGEPVAWDTDTAFEPDHDPDMYLAVNEDDDED